MTIKQKIALLLNLASAGFQFYCTIFSCVTRGLPGFQYYTLDSNILAGISSILLVVFLLANKSVPAWVHKLRYFGTCCVTVTFVVVNVPVEGLNIKLLFLRDPSVRVVLSAVPENNTS